MCPYLHMIVEMIKPVSFVICSVLYQHDPLKHPLKLQAAFTRLHCQVVGLAEISLEKSPLKSDVAETVGGDRGTRFKAPPTFHGQIISI